MSEQHPLLPLTPSALFHQLTSFAYEKDYEFSKDLSQGMTIERQSLIYAGYSDAEEDESWTGEPRYDRYIVSLLARRLSAGTPPRGKKVAPPTFFKVNYQKDTIDTQIPPHLHQYVDQESVKQDEELHIIQKIEYDVSQDEIMGVDIQRNISYQLLDSVGMSLYHSAEIAKTDAEAYLTANASNPLLTQHMNEERHPDTYGQFFYDETFSDLLDGALHPEFYTDLLKERDAEASLCIQALLRSLKSNHRIPDVIATPPQAG